MQEVKKSNIFLSSVIDEVPRLLGQLNRNPSSGAYGSFDRAFWHYRVNDISSARYQEAILTLSLLYSTRFEGNIYFGDKKILEWLRAALDFTRSIQNRDGSFDEWYLREGSFVATSFVVAALARAVALLGPEELPAYEAIVATLRKGADWVLRHEEIAVFNQVAGSAAALLGVFNLTREPVYQKEAEKKIKFMLARQTDEGWWEEYGGPDIGYLSLTVDYLSLYFKETGDKSVLDSLKKANFFITHFLHPDLTTGGEYMSRNTEYLIPSGFARLAEVDGSASQILEFGRAALSAKKGIYPQALDDRYLCYILYNWLEAGLLFKYEQSLYAAGAAPIYDSEIFFEKAGIRVVRKNHYYLVVNLRKGGAFRIYSGNRMYSDSGVEAQDGRNAYSSGVLDSRNTIWQNSNVFGARGFLKPLREPLMKTPVMLVFKSFQLFIGWIDYIQRAVKKILRKKMILYRDKTRLSFERSFRLSKDLIEITDSIDGRLPFDCLRFGLKSSYLFIPSSKYFIREELDKNLLNPSDERRASENGQNIFIRVFRLGDKNLTQ